MAIRNFLARFSSNSWTRAAVPGMLLILLVVLAYLPVLRNGFIWDDDVYITDDSLLTAPGGLLKIWFSLDVPSQYFPLVYTVFRFERDLWGVAPMGYHLFNLLLHTINALLVWRLLKRLSVPGAWLGAALFALHPVQVETVAWATELKNVMSLFFILLVLLAWIRFVEERPKPAWQYYGLALIFYGLALCSKTTACTLPAALLLILWLQHKPIGIARWLQVVPFVIMGLGMGLVAMWWERYHQGTEGATFSISLLERFLIAGHAVWFYLGKLLWPVNLTFSYPRWTINPADPLAYGWLVAGAGTAAAIYLARRIWGRSVEVAALFYVATLFPMLGFFMLYTFRYSFVADHYQYVACIGPLALVAAGISTGLSRFDKASPILKPVFCGALLLVLGILTWQRTEVFRNRETLWRDTLAKNPDSWMAYGNLGLLFQKQGHFEEAFEYFQKALQLNPDYFEALNDLGTMFVMADHYNEAIDYFRRANRIQPNSFETLKNLGSALAATGQFDEAIEDYRKAIQIDPKNPETFLYLGMTLGQAGREREAVDAYQAALKLNPGLPEALNNLALILGTSSQDELRNGPEAVHLAERACQLTQFHQPQFIETLAAAYAEAGQFQEAQATEAEVERLATAAGSTAQAERAQRLLERYRAGQPLREPPPPKP
ncbi:MAG TPA: tetratricopeptide repeat protein [Candidatus Saccharimonadales bacterium]|nr:tetratricopeptide repeat protein [Candidatus Saccharimonadales bacterium]